MKQLHFSYRETTVTTRTLNLVLYVNDTPDPAPAALVRHLPAGPLGVVRALPARPQLRLLAGGVK